MSDGARFNTALRLRKLEEASASSGAVPGEAAELGVSNFHDLDGLPQRFPAEVHAWNDPVVHAGPTLALPVDLIVGNLDNASVTLPNGAGSAAEYSSSRRHRAPADLSAARWLRVLVRTHLRGSADARFRFGVTTNGTTFTMLTDSTGAVLDWAVPAADTDFDSGVVDLHPSVQLHGNATLAVFVYGTGTGTVTIDACRLLIGVLG